MYGDKRIAGEPDASTCRHESEELYAEYVDQHLAVLTDIVTRTVEVTIDDIQVGDLIFPMTKDHERLRQMIWRNKHLLIGKGNVLPPASQGGGRYAIFTWEE